MILENQTVDDLCLNILIASTCNAGCSFCIADDYMKNNNCSNFMSEEDFQVILEMLKKEKVVQANLLGGEPSLHPHALDFARKIIDTENSVNFSTNGFWSNHFRKEFEKIDFPMEFEVTYLGEKNYTPEKLKLMKKTFEQLRGKDVSLGFIVFSDDSDYSEHLDICREYGFKLRWALLEPTPKTGMTAGYENLSYLRGMGNLATKMVKDANNSNIQTWADLTVPRCAIDDLTLFEGKRNDIQFKCPPFFDISPNLSIWRCLPLAPQETPRLTDFKSLREAYENVNLVKRKYSDKGIFKECETCNYFDIVCSGGPAAAKKIKNEL